MLKHAIIIRAQLLTKMRLNAIIPINLAIVGAAEKLNLNSNVVFPGLRQHS